MALNLRLKLPAEVVRIDAKPSCDERRDPARPRKKAITVSASERECFALRLGPRDKASLPLLKIEFLRGHVELNFEGSRLTDRYGVILRRDVLCSPSFRGSNTLRRHSETSVQANGLTAHVESRCEFLLRYTFLCLSHAWRVARQASSCSKNLSKFRGAAPRP